MAAERGSPARVAERAAARIAVHGCGCVGLVTAACLAAAGHRVLCVDVDRGKIRRLRRGELPIHEPGLADLVARAVDAGRLRFAAEPADGVRFGPFQFIAVGTPARADGAADVRHVLAVAACIGRHLRGHRIVVNRSTVPVGTADRIRETVGDALRMRAATGRFDVVANPEFLAEGAAVRGFMKPDRIVIGTDSARAAEALRTLYEPFDPRRDRFILMDARSAELTKYAANAMLATRISFMNEMANLAERLGADVEHVRAGIGSDPRIGDRYLYPGCGYGGSCLPKDLGALAACSAAAGHESELLSAVAGVNARQRRWLFDRVSAHFDGALERRTIALWGLAFKPDTRDMREAPSRVLMEAFWRAGGIVRAYDPVAMEEARRLYPDRSRLILCRSAADAAHGADALAVLTEWRQFRRPDLRALKSALRTPVVFDGRNVLDPARMKRHGFTYFGVGRADGPAPETQRTQAHPPGPTSRPASDARRRRSRNSPPARDRSGHLRCAFPARQHGRNS